MSESLPVGYALRLGSTLDRALLLSFIHKTYAEISPETDFTHLAETVDQYLSRDTPLWWVYQPGSEAPTGLPSRSACQPRSGIVGCLWLGTAIAQSSGLRHPHIFLLYIAPSHRRQGLGKALMRQAEEWARQRGDRLLSLQVFQTNQPALNLYRSLGYETESLWLVKQMGEE
jgi:ribosomal protein S18 acetylase RimI-like enzyme